MNREDAILRELNLYPLWQRRGAAAPAQAAEVEVQAAEEAVVESNAPAVEAMPKVSPVARPASAPSPATDTVSDMDWATLKKTVRDCTACKLRAGCTQTVFGVGDEKADWLFVGEGPGADEDAKGEPFVGQAGKLLDNMLLAIKLKRGKDVYIANVVKCRPPGNRTPEADEIATCLPYLRRQIALIQPRVIVALGKTAANALLGQDATLGSLRGKVHAFENTPLIITYHPAYLLRSPHEKAKAWADLKLATHTASKS